MGFKLRHLWFSRKAAEMGGTSIYRLTTGDEVQVTEANAERDHKISWDDVKYLGQGTYIRQGQQGEKYVPRIKD